MIDCRSGGLVSEVRPPQQDSENLDRFLVVGLHAPQNRFDLFESDCEIPNEVIHRCFVEVIEISQMLLIKSFSGSLPREQGLCWISLWCRLVYELVVGLAEKDEIREVVFVDVRVVARPILRLRMNMGDLKVEDGVSAALLDDRLITRWCVAGALAEMNKGFLRARVVIPRPQVSLRLSVVPKS